jgi:hypothetical protein
MCGASDAAQPGIASPRLQATAIGALAFDGSCSIAARVGTPSLPPAGDIAEAIAAAPGALILAELKVSFVSAEHRSTANAMEATPRSCIAFADRFREDIWWGGSSMSTSAKAQHVELVMPMLTRSIQQRDLSLSRVSILLLFGEAQAIEALPYLILQRDAGQTAAALHDKR